MNKIILAMLFATSTAWAAPQSFKVDSGHTYPSFEIDHFGISTQRGRFNETKGNIVVDESTGKASVDVVIQAASIATGNPALEKHLKSADFFDVDVYPTIHFKSDDVIFQGSKPVKLWGTLTMHGVSKRIGLTMNHYVVKPHPFTQKPVLGAEASAVIQRSDFGLKTALPGVSDDVKLLLNIEAIGE